MKQLQLYGLKYQDKGDKMLSLLLVAALSCPTPKIDNQTGTWNKFDQTTLENAEKRCGELFPDGPCVHLFVKKDGKDGITYNVVCGAE